MRTFHVGLQILLLVALCLVVLNSACGGGAAPQVPEGKSPAISSGPPRPALDGAYIGRCIQFDYPLPWYAEEIEGTGQLETITLAPEPPVGLHLAGDVIMKFMADDDGFELERGDADLVLHEESISVDGTPGLLRIVKPAPDPLFPDSETSMMEVFIDTESIHYFVFALSRGDDYAIPKEIISTVNLYCGTAEQAEVEDFAIEFVRRVAGDTDWLLDHCGDIGGCEGDWYQSAASCATHISSAVARRHRDPQGEWRVAVLLSPSCEPPGENWAYPCIKIDVENESGGWQGSVPGWPAAEEDCSPESEWF